MSNRHLFFSMLVLALAAWFARGQDNAEAVRQQQLVARLQQYVQLLTPAMWSELDFIRQVCDLTPEQRPQIRDAADVATEETAKAMIQPQQGAIRISQPMAGAQKIQDLLRAELKKTLSSEQFERFEAEDAARTAVKKQTAIVGTVALLDSGLYLSKEQREKITAALNKGWQREWEQWIMMHQYNGQYFPQVPEQHVVPHLSAEQKLVWDGMQKVTINSWHMNQNQQHDDAWWKPKPAAAAKTTGKNAKGKAALLKPAKKAN